MTQPNILMFDSGLGGLTVFREVAAARPDANFVYAADDAFFPYNGHGEAALVVHVVPLMGDLIARVAPDLIVIACNTASTLVLAPLRARYSVPFVGTVPAIKPACASSKTKRVTVLGTEATVAREYTKKLIHDFAPGIRRVLVASANAEHAERVVAELGASFDIARASSLQAALEVALAQLEVVRGEFRNALAGLNKLGDALKQAQRENKASEKEISSVRATLRSQPFHQSLRPFDAPLPCQP